MFARASSLFIFILFALPLLAAATAIPRDDPIPASQCNTGNLQCCSSTQSVSTTLANVLSGLLGVAIGDIGALIGLTCSGISVIGVGGTSCTQQPVCCTNNSFGGLVSLGCSPVNLNL